MELANGKKNKFFTPKEEDKDRYYLENFDANNTKGINNIWMLTKEVENESIVIDIGCSQGNFGKTLKEKKCIVYGIEKNKRTAEIALNSGYYEDVFVTDLMDLESSEYNRFLNNVSYADVIIMSDILEHIEEPTEALVNYSRMLRHKGIILISVPNISHIDIILNLMNGRFNYTDLGILDNTHLKYFTKNSFIEWIMQINNVYSDLRLDCEYLGSTFYNNEYINEIKTNYPELFRILEHCENYNGLQILFKLKKLTTEEKAENLEKLILNPKIDIVSLLGKVLKNIFKNNNIPKIVEGERYWYDMQFQKLKDGIAWHQNNDVESKRFIQQLENRVKELEDGIAWHQNNDVESNRFIQQLENRVKELEEGIAWHQNNDVESKRFSQELENRVKELEDGIAWHQNNDVESNRFIQQLENRVKELEDGIAWHQNNDVESKRFSQELENRVKELEAGIVWHQNNDVESKQFTQQLENRVKELEEGISWHIKFEEESCKNLQCLEEKLKASEDKNNVLRSKIYKIETSFSWKITKWLRR